MNRTAPSSSASNPAPHTTSTSTSSSASARSALPPSKAHPLRTALPKPISKPAAARKRALTDITNAVLAAHHPPLPSSSNSTSNSKPKSHIPPLHSHSHSQQDKNPTRRASRRLAARRARHAPLSSTTSGSEPVDRVARAVGTITMGTSTNSSATNMAAAAVTANGTVSDCNTHTGTASMTTDAMSLSLSLSTATTTTAPTGVGRRQHLIHTDHHHHRQEQQQNDTLQEDPAEDACTQPDAEPDQQADTRDHDHDSDCDCDATDAEGDAVVHDIDMLDMPNCLTAAPYASVAHDNLRRCEDHFFCTTPTSTSTASATAATSLSKATTSPPSGYAPHSQISDRMRSVLLDWLVDVHHKHRLRSETLFLTVSVLDRVLALLPVARRTFQLLGMVSLWVASKFEDNIPPEVSDLVYVCDGAYTRTDVIREEARLLNALRFQLNMPTTLPFLRRAIKAAAAAGRFTAPEVEEDVACLARYVSEIALFAGGDVRAARPSVVACAALRVAAALLRVALPWGSHMKRCTGWDAREVRPVERGLMGAVVEEGGKTKSGGVGTGAGSKLSALRRKFNSARYCHIAARLPKLVAAHGGGGGRN